MVQILKIIRWLRFVSCSAVWKKLDCAERQREEPALHCPHVCLTPVAKSVSNLVHCLRILLGAGQLL